MEHHVFEQLAKQTRLSEKSIVMARKVMIDGITLAEVGRTHHVSRQRVKQVVDRITRQQKIVNQLPENWKAKTIVLPPEWLTLIGYLDSRVKQKKGIHVREKRQKPPLDDEMLAILASVIAGK